MDSNASVLAVVPMLQGINNVALCNMGSIMLIIWDYCITLHKEVQHFWSGRWTLSRVLFLWNRYLSLAWALLEVYNVYTDQVYMKTLSAGNPGQLPNRLIFADAFLTASLMSLVEAMHALRLWYMFPNSKPLRTVTGLLSVSYVVGEFTAIGFFAKSWSSAKPSNGVIWLPTTIIHVLLYSLTLIRAFRARSTQGSVGFLMKQTLKEGGIFLIVSLLSLLAVSIGAQSRNTSISIGAQLSGFPMSTMSVAMSRLMLRIRSLSASLNTSPEWLLSHLEMSRLHFRTGQREGELLVEVGSAGDYELSSLPAIGCPVQVVSTTHTDSDGSTAAFGKDGPSHLA